MKKIWETKDGNEIEIKDMSNSHLLNTIALLKRKANEGAEIVVCCGYSGDDDYITGVTEWVEGQEYLETIPAYPWLIEEANKRKLLFLK